MRFTAALALAALVGLAGCAAPGPGLKPGAAPQGVEATLTVDGVDLPAHWHLPAGPPRGLVTLQHGFSRSCRHLRGTAAAISAAGLAVLCLDASMTGGNAALARALADMLAVQLDTGRIALPDGRTAPPRVVVSGHSAGAHFAVVLGAHLARRHPQAVAGAVLLDPVAGRGFAEAALALAEGARRPVLSIAAAEHPCNARHNAHLPLRRVAEAARAAGGDGFIGVVQGEGSTHMDAEGEDADALAWLACGRRWPDPANVAVLRELAAAWVMRLSGGPRREATGGSKPSADPTWPGGERFEGWLRSGVVRALR
jgi:pimeloyl-ACP methyl ester carboxylesterase